jgi:hypothetical protein
MFALTGEIAMSEQAAKILVLRAKEDGSENIREFTFQVFCDGLEAQVTTTPTNPLPVSERVGALMNDLRRLSAALTSAAGTPELVDWSHLPEA